MVELAASRSGTPSQGQTSGVTAHPFRSYLNTSNVFLLQDAEWLGLQRARHIQADDFNFDDVNFSHGTFSQTTQLPALVTNPNLTRPGLLSGQAV